MEPSPVTSWQIDEEKVETVTDFVFLGSKITVDGDCSHKIKRHLLHGRKAMINLDSILESSILKIANIHWIIQKAREFQKNIYFCSLTTVKPLTM